MAKAKDPEEQKIEDETTAEVAEATEEVSAVEDAEETTVEGVEESAEEAEPKLAKAGKRSKKAVEEVESEEARKAAAAEKKEAEPAKKIIHVPNPRNRHGKNYLKSLELVDKTKQYELEEAIELIKKTSTVKFDASLELHVNLGLDPKQADQMVRASVVLPAGTGKSLKVAVLAPASEHEAVKKAGADLVGEDDLLAKIEKGQLGFDRLITTPAMMPKLAKLAKVLGPKGLMPNPKSGSVTNDLVKAIEESKAGKVEFRIDRQAIVHQSFGKVSFKNEDLLENAKVLIQAIMKAKPSAAKGTYVLGMSLTTSMGPGIKIGVQQAIAAANPKK
jgi:large subunit ribosomal protein L1